MLRLELIDMGAQMHQNVARLGLAPHRTILSTCIYMWLLIYAVGGPDYVQIKGSRDQAQELM